MEEQPVETTLYSLSDRTPDPVERREGERFLTLFRVGTVMVEDRRELCLIKNISAGGMMIRPYCKLEAGMPLSVELKRGEQIPGIVNWVRGDSAGISFDKSIDVVELLASSMEGPRPRMPRIEVSCFATLREGASTYRMRACDISQGGLKLIGETVIPVASDIVVSLPGLEPQRGVVRWNEGGQIGITFNRLLPLSDLVGWLQAQRDGIRAAS